MAVDHIIFLLIGALAGGLVNGLTGFGTGLTALGIWLYAVSPSQAASLVLICSVVSQIQTFPMIWQAFRLKRVAPFIIPGLLGVPIGTLLLLHVDPRAFKVVVGLFLVTYSTYMLVTRSQMRSEWGGWIADSGVGFGGGICSGLAGLSGIFPIIWTDVRGWSKDERRSVLQAFNFCIQLAALGAHVFSGLLTTVVGWAALVALPGTLGGVWVGTRVYKRLGDRGFGQVVLCFLLLSGGTLIWAALV